MTFVPNMPCVPISTGAPVPWTCLPPTPICFAAPAWNWTSRKPMPWLRACSLPTMLPSGYRRASAIFYSTTPTAATPACRWIGSVLRRASICRSTRRNLKLPMRQHWKTTPSTSTKRTDGIFVYLEDYYIAERYIADRIGVVQDFSAPEDQEIFEKMIDTQQQEQGMQYAALQRKGHCHCPFPQHHDPHRRPGTGKTTTLNAIIELYEKQGYRVMIAAPTGRAASAFLISPATRQAPFTACWRWNATCPATCGSSTTNTTRWTAM